MLAGVFGIGISCLLCYFSGQKLTTLKIGSNSVITLPVKDKKRLEYLFRELVDHDCFAYTLIGDKPMSLGAYLDPFSSLNVSLIFQSLTPRNLQMYFAWKTWLKYQRFFAEIDYMLWAEPNPWIEGGKLIIFVNKKNMNALVHEYEEDFQNVLHIQNLDGEQLLLQIKNRPFFSDTLKCHEALIGMLLGYGRINAWLFWNKMQGEKVLISSVWEQEIQDRALEKLTFWNLLFENQKTELSSTMFYPTFMGDPASQETEQIKALFRGNRDRIIEYYKNKDFLESTLALLSDESTIYSHVCVSRF